MKYTHNNNELTIKNVNETVRLKGWVQKVRNLGGLLFVDLRDRFGITQLVIKPESKSYLEATKLRSEYVIEVEGEVIKRESINSKIKTGEIEVIVNYLHIFSEAQTPPIIVSDDTDALEDTRLKYRYLDLRRPVMQNFLIKRHEIMQVIREVLVKEGFYEFETPILAKSTPEGARDYLVPSRLYHGEFYALPQSPQMFKQLFMISGFERYFQMAKCFRDEDLRADRQPEFTQVDIEASFITQEDIIVLSEKIMVSLLKKMHNIDLSVPFPRMTFNEAMEKYGVDKPDTRFSLLLSDLNQLKDYQIPLFSEADTIKGIHVQNASSISRKQIDQYQELVKKHHGKALSYLKVSDEGITGSLAKNVDEAFVKNIGLEKGDILFVVGGRYDDVCQSLGALRNKLGVDLNLIDESLFNFLWVVDFPLLEYSEEDKRFYARHHPFTSPKNIKDLYETPNTALADAYDLILNGYELGGGSIRIHDQNLQKKMFETLGLTKKDIEERFGFFVEALQYGTPPHGGIAFGLDRIVMLMTGTNNIKDVIAFPKTQSARDLMMSSPSEVEDNQLVDLGIKISK